MYNYRNHIFILIIFFILVFILLIATGSFPSEQVQKSFKRPFRIFEDPFSSTTSIECGSTPTDLCVVTISTTFNPGTYNIPNGIFIEANDITLDCNGAVLKGTTSTAASGIFMDGRTGNTIKNCVIDGYREGSTSRGIHLINSDNNILESNVIKSNWQGIEFDSGSDNNLVTQNTIRDNNGAGIKLDSGSNNNIYNNNFISNVVQASDSGNNNWDGGDYLTGGNYWNDHSCVDTAEPFDICDNTYTSGFTDNYPFEFESGWDLNRHPLLLEPNDNTNQITVVEGQTVSIYTLAEDPNQDESTLTYEIDDPRFSQIPGSGTTFEWKPDYTGNEIGVHNFIITVTDDGNLQDSQGVIVTVNDNQPPVVEPIASQIDRLENSGVFVFITATDDYQQGLIYSIVKADDSPSPFEPYAAPSGFRWKTSKESSGTHTFKGVVFDGEFIEEQTFTITIKNNCTWDKTRQIRTGNGWYCSPQGADFKDI